MIEKLTSPDESEEQGVFDQLVDVLYRRTEQAGQIGRASLGWQESAICRGVDPDLFFPDKGQSPAPAKKVCMRCDVRDTCLEFALATGERFGVWGGLTARERNQLRKRAA